MTEKELRRLSRIELLGLLLDEVRKNEALEAKINDLQERLDERSQLETARAASEQYAEGVQKLTERQEAFLAKMESELPSADAWQQMSESIAQIKKEQKALRDMIAFGGKGAKR